MNTDLKKALSRYGGPATWPELVDAWHRNLEQLAIDFLGGEMRVDPLKGACQYCGLQALCRVDLPREEVR